MSKIKVLTSIHCNFKRVLLFFFIILENVRFNANFRGCLFRFLADGICNLKDIFLDGKVFGLV